MTDSLASRVRWRVSDYEAIVRAEIGMLLEGQNLDVTATLVTPLNERG